MIFTHLEFFLYLVYGKYTWHGVYVIHLTYPGGDSMFVCVHSAYFTERRVVVFSHDSREEYSTFFDDSSLLGCDTVSLGK